MNIKGIKTGLKYLASSVLIYKREDSNPVLKKAEEKLKSSMESETSLQEEFDYDYEVFDRVSDKWFEAFNHIEEASEILFNEFASFEGGRTDINWEKLTRALDLLPSLQSRHLLILGIKYHGLGEQAQGNIKRAVNKNAKVSAGIGPNQTNNVSRRHQLLKKEELVLNEMHKVSTKMNIETLRSKLT